MDYNDAMVALVKAGHTVSQGMGPWSPWGLYRIDGGPELTEMQLIDVARRLPPEDKPA